MSTNPYELHKSSAIFDAELHTGAHVTVEAGVDSAPGFTVYGPDGIVQLYLDHRNPRLADLCDALITVINDHRPTTTASLVAAAPEGQPVWAVASEAFRDIIIATTDELAAYKAAFAAETQLIVKFINGEEVSL